MFRAFLDESYNSRVFIISGFAADTTVWPSIEAQWNRAIKRKHLKRYHAVDCFHGKEDFQDWSREDREELTAELSRILAHRRPSSSEIRQGIYGVTYATDREGYQDLMTGSPYPNEYMLLLQLMIRKLATLCQALPSTDRIDVVMDRNASFTGKATELFERLARDPRVEHRERLGSISFDSSEELGALQGADLLAYETLRYLDQKLSGSEFEIRGSLNHVLNKIAVHGWFIPREGLFDVLQEFSLRKYLCRTLNAHF